MKRGQTTSSLCFCMLYSTAFIGWLCSKEPISSLATPVSKYGGETFLGIRLCLAPAQDSKNVGGLG